MTDFRRSDRVARLVQEELSTLVRREVRDPRVRNVTITRVAVTDDLREANVYFTPLGGLSDGERIEELLAGLNHAAPFLQGKIGRALQLRSTPRLRFHFDKGVENLIHIHELLHQEQPTPVAGAGASEEGDDGSST